MIVSREFHLGNISDTIQYLKWISRFQWYKYCYWNRRSRDVTFVPSLFIFDRDLSALPLLYKDEQGFDQKQKDIAQGNYEWST